MKRVCLTFLLLAFGLITQAQSFSVKEFYLNGNDLTARTHGTSVEDQNGNLCALIKVETTEKGLWTFDVGMLGVRNTEMQNLAHSAEIWVYVPYGVTWISIQHEHLGKLSRYTFPCSIEKGCTYVMELVTGNVTTVVEEVLPVPTPNYGSLNVESTPKFCHLFIDGNDMGTTPKSINQILIGQHEIVLTKKGYAEYRDTVTVTKGERKHIDATLTADGSAQVAEKSKQTETTNGDSGGGESEENSIRRLGANASGFYNGHAYVDLGLPSGTLWATCNVGAVSPEDYGDYFAWGETNMKSSNYDWATYKYCNGSYDKLTKYCNSSGYGCNDFTDNLTTLQTSDDAATANWGLGWCMPTKAQWEELKSNTTVTWTTQNGVKGRKFVASNGNSLFLPAAGYHGGSSLDHAGSYGYYWSSSLNTGNPNGAWKLYFSSDYCNMAGYARDFGQSVRAVRSASQNQNIVPSSISVEGHIYNSRMENASE